MNNNNRNDACVDFFIAVLSVFLTPTFAVPSADSSSKGQGTGNQQNQQKEFILSEEDYLALWQQFPFFNFLNYLFVKSQSILVIIHVSLPPSLQ